MNPLTPNVTTEGETSARILRSHWNEGMPPQPVTVGGGLSRFVEGWKHMTNDPYILTIVSQGYRLHFTSFYHSIPSMQVPMGNTEIQKVLMGNTKEHNIRVATTHSGVLLQCISHTKDLRRVDIVIDLKQLNAHLDVPHFCMFTMYKLTSEYRKKRRLLVQNRSRGCILSLTDPPRQPEIPSLHLQEQYQFRILPFCPNIAPDVYSPGAHCSGLSPSSRNISTTLSQ